MKEYWNWLCSWNWDDDYEYAWVILLIKILAWLFFAILGLELACVYYLFAFFISAIMKMKNPESQNFFNGTSIIESIIGFFIIGFISLVSLYALEKDYCPVLILNFLAIINIFFRINNENNLFKRIYITYAIFSTYCFAGWVIGFFGIVFFVPNNNNGDAGILSIQEIGAILTYIIVYTKTLASFIINTVKKSKNSTDSLYLRADNLYKDGKYNEALKYYQLAYNADISTIDYYYYAKGMTHYAQKDYEKTLSCLDTLSRLESDVKDECLDLIETIKKEYADLTEKAKQELKTKVNRLYNESLNCKWSKNYIQALNHITEALKIAKQEKLDTSKFVKLKDELTDHINNEPKAKNKFQSALQAYKNKDYVLAINNLENAIKLTPDNEEYQAKLQDFKNEYQEILSKTDDYYNKAKRFFESNNFEKATTEVNNALKYLKDKKYTKLKNNITDKQQRIQNEQEAEKLYSEAQNLYNSDNANFDKILDILNRVVELSPKKAYKDMLNKVKKESDLITAEKLYEEAKECFNNKNFDKGLSLIKQAVKLDPSNRMYIDLKQKIDWEQKEIEKTKKANESFEYGLEAFQDGDFDEAIEYFEEALKLQPHNAECKTLLQKAKIGKIDIVNCTKDALLTLDFINEEQAESIVQARNNGEMWYDYQKFAERFEIMPHLWTNVEEKIEFPLKQANRYGRRLV